LRRTSSRCHRSRVRGVTTKALHRSLERIRLAAGEQHSVPPAKRRAANASREDLELMSKDQQLGFALQVAAI
jgi:hypothetical protein